MRQAAPHRRMPHAGLLDTLGVLFGVLLPTLAKGPIIRRRRVVALAERWDLDMKAVRRMQRLHDKHRGRPLLLPLPFRRQLLLLAPEHVNRILDASPEPFATATAEKRAALRHFEPKGALISHGAPRTDRRRFNEEALQSDDPVHPMAAAFLRVVQSEAERILALADRQGELGWDEFAAGWFRVVRRVVFGDAAAEDHQLTAMIDRLRSRGNWGPAPLRRGLRARFHARLGEHLARAEPGSLAAMIARIRQTPVTSPVNQVPQWLFAFDPAGMTTFRALALLAAHPQAMRRAREESAAQTGDARAELPYLRAVVLESLRLWPTTPLLLRETTRETTWESGTLPAGTGIILFAPFFHRDDRVLPAAHRLAPEIWLDGGPPREWGLVPFSGGPGICPGRHLVLLLTSAMLAAILERNVRLTPPEPLSARRPLPGTLNHFALRFRVSRSG
jgi:cytochrome P450